MQILKILLPKTTTKYCYTGQTLCPHAGSRYQSCFWPSGCDTKINANATPELTTRLKHTILSVNGDRTTKTVRDFIDKQISYVLKFGKLKSNLLNYIYSNKT